MRPARLAALVTLATLPLAGCRTAGVGTMTRPEPVATAPGAGARELIAEHNKNAARIRSLTAKPSITVRSPELSGHVDGRLALDRPRNFKLELTYGMGTKAGDIGSNDDEFWFWFLARNAKRQSVYYCKYEEIASSAVAATFQPDWIIEAMGLRLIPDAEAAEISIRRGAEPGTLELVHRPSKSGGRTITRVTVLDEATHRVRMHKLLSGDQKTLLAQATVTAGYQKIPIDAGSADGADAALVPRVLRLDWVEEKLTLEVTMKSVQASAQPLPDGSRAAFVEPDLGKGAERVSLARATEGADADDDSSPSIRETMPAPPTRVRLGDPTPLGLDDAGRKSGDPLALSSDDLTPPSNAIEPYVGPRTPSPPDPDVALPQGPGSGWRNAAPPSFER